LRVLIIDYECISPLGMTLEESWGNLSVGRSGIRFIDRYEPSSVALRGVSSVPFGGQVPLSYPELAGSARNFDRWPEPAYHAVRTTCDRLLQRIAFDISEHNPQRIAIIGATALTSQISQDILQTSNQANVNFILNQCQTTPVAAVAIQYGIKGPVFSVASACASSGHAIYLASQLIESGAIDCALVCGFEFPLLPVCTGGFSWLHALYKRDGPDDRAYHDPTQASRPFSHDRRGFVPAEGVGVVLLTHEKYALSRGWAAKGALRGAYINSDADHLTRLSIRDVALCMHGAITAAGYSAHDIEVVSAHSTSTKVGDAAELAALSLVFGEERLKTLPIVATKSQIGHTLGAASILALIFAFEGMRTQTLLPTLNYEQDASLPTVLVSERPVRGFEHHVAMINSFGFGGLNAVLIVSDQS
jgi:3-oxoacyl-[acyl-carrier-protein] synthase II